MSLDGFSTWKGSNAVKAGAEFCMHFGGELYR